MPKNTNNTKKTGTHFVMTTNPKFKNIKLF